jgi:hypothetical protein
MVQELIAKEEKKSSFSINFLLFISILILISSGAGYFWIKSQVNETEEEVQQLHRDILSIKEGKNKEIEKQVFDYAKKINDFSALIGEREELFPFFDFLEGLTHRRVSLTNLFLETKTGDLSLEGKTENFKILAEQMLIFEENNSVINPTITNLSLGEEGGVEFGIALSLDPGIFNNE